MPPPDSVYPAALDDFPVIEPNSGEAAPETEHDVVHEHVHQGLKAVQATVGVTGSDVPGTVHYRLDSLEAAVTELEAAIGDVELEGVVTTDTAQDIVGDKDFFGRIASRTAFLTTAVVALGDVLASAQTREVDLDLAPVQTLLTEFGLTLNAAGPAAAAGWVVLYVYNAGAAAIDVTRGSGWFGSTPLSVEADETCKFHLHWDGVRMSAGLVEAAGASSGDLRPAPTVVSISGGPLSDALEGEAYSASLTISGGNPPYALGTVSGLPSGLSASIDGTAVEVTGTPALGESSDSPFALVIEVDDAEGQVGTYTQSFVVNADYASVLDDEPNYKLHSLLLHFNGPNASTEIVDQMGNFWTAVGNAQITTSTAKFGSGALLLDGSGDYITAQIPNCIGTGDFRVRGWIRLDSLSTDAEIFCVSSDSFSTSEFNLVFEAKTTGALRGAIQTGSGGGVNVDITTATGLISTGVWHYVEFNAVGATARVFIDGVVRASGTITGTRSNDRSNCRLGFLSNDFGGIVTRYFNGRIDDFVVSKTTGPTSDYTPPEAQLPSIPVPMFESAFAADGYNAAQGVVTDGTHVWFSSGTTIYKYTTAGSLVTSRNTASDSPTAKEQVNGMCIKDGKLYVSAALYAAGEGSSWVVEYDLETLDYITHRQLTGDWFSECVDYAHGSWWVIFHANMVVGQYDDEWNLIDTHALTFSVTGSSGGYGPGTGYESGKWRGNYLFCNVHEVYNQNLLDVYAWNGTAFAEVCRWPHRRQRASQGLCFDPTDPDVMIFAEREYDSPPDRVARMALK